MKQLVECTHTYNGRPVKILNYMDYLNSPDYVLIMDPQSGETMKVPSIQLKPLATLSLSSIRIVDKKKELPKKKVKGKNRSIKKESFNEDVSDRISNFLKKKDEKTGLTIKDRYDGIILAIKDLRTMSGVVYKKGKEYFALKEKNTPKVNVYQDAGKAVISKELNKNYQIMPLEVFNNYFSSKVAFVKEEINRYNK